MRRPLIAINATLENPPGSPPKVSVQQAYLDAVIAAGGLPLVVPPRADLVEKHLALADGVLFTGGLDYPPSLYGERPHGKVRPQTKERTEADLALMRLVRSSPKPALGICAGLQLLNIESGGGLVQHLDDADSHVSAAGRDSTHMVRVLPGTRLAGLFGEREIKVNSSHHQAVNPGRLGRGLKITALAADGTVEGLELRKAGGRFFVFVQWHPERIADSAHRRKLFSAFIDSCRARL